MALAVGPCRRAWQRLCLCGVVGVRSPGVVALVGDVAHLVVVVFVAAGLCVVHHIVVDVNISVANTMSNAVAVWRRHCDSVVVAAVVVCCADVVVALSSPAISAWRVFSGLRDGSRCC